MDEKTFKRALNVRGLAKCGSGIALTEKTKINTSWISCFVFDFRSPVLMHYVQVRQITVKLFKHQRVEECNTGHVTKLRWIYKTGG